MPTDTHSHTHTHTHTHVCVYVYIYIGTINTSYDIYNNFKCNDNTIHINMNEHERTSNVGYKLNCMLKNGEFAYRTIEIYNNYTVVDKILECGDVFINGKIWMILRILIRFVFIRLMYLLPKSFIKL